jgi:hypothetical protein
MMRMLALICGVLAMALTGVCCASISSASPTDGSGRCTFAITPPTVVPVSGVNYVMATLRPGPCTLHANPNMSTVCLSIEGDGSSGQCLTENGPNPAMLYYTYRPGATYVEKGQGCASVNNPPNTLCEDFPASRFTL